MGEIFGPEFRAPFAFDFPEYLVDFGVRGVPAPGEADNPRTTLLGSARPDEIPGLLEASEEAVHGLLAHASALGERAGANPIRARKLEHRNMRHTELFETGRIQILDDPAMDGLSRNTQQRAYEHFAGFEGRPFFRSGD